MFSGLHPGTTYLVSVRARTAKGFGQTALTEITTNISGEEICIATRNNPGYEPCQKTYNFQLCLSASEVLNYKFSTRS